MTKRTVIVVGAGIAGCTIAYELASRGFDVTVLEASAEVASGASGNDVGIIYPRLEAAWTKAMDFYIQGLEATLALLKRLSSAHCIFERTGIIRFAKDDEDVRRLQKIIELLSQKVPNLVEFLDTNVIKDVGITCSTKGAIFINQVGYVRPKILCSTLIRDVSTLYNHKVYKVEYRGGVWVVHCDFLGSLRQLECTILVFANAYYASHIEQLQFLEPMLRRVRGQISLIQATECSAGLKTVLCGLNGYITPSVEGWHYVGANYDYHNLSTEPDIAGENHNRQIWCNYFGKESCLKLAVLPGRASIRCVSKNRMPIIGPLEQFSNLYVSIGHGSRGMISGPIAAKMIAEYIRPLA
ncbi:FAD-dependent oxidoreductase [Rickettsiales endosymbiont of Peranema trichophorum]|uniref:FAD-dependent 5-carboxymethylaminomethyl-2-thiouridine(34) oxidoreductase MnmC n=1 Tax=Rickettsiales endosymbiont of Peranema trichophorum TaxID=2486577 RepID=UPI0010230AF7|nr:FAD-dependent 5-carboxymethylaminomethyl-2-thiouridine(34) oxidoreductase MnmC [Rickettsiales endosymbiont of Peranema trichophorum]RZI47348.1 FAD-dependent oxidoreductase [Rickettsiales endosymbiont of Peranema trichophorum]